MFYLAFVLGLTSSLHCVGMCGPIALALPVHRRSGAGKALGIVLYNLGRISVYALLGALIGSIGFAASLGQWQNWLSIVAGGLMVAAAAGSLNWWEKLPFQGIVSRGTSFVYGNIQSRLSKGSFSSLTLMGMFNGLIPCGMVYLALASTLALPDAASGAAYMALFGSGTLPAMLATGFLGQWASVKWRLAFKRATPYLVALAGIILIVRGLLPVSAHLHHGASDAIPVCVGK